MSGASCLKVGFPGFDVNEAPARSPCGYFERLGEGTLAFPAVNAILRYSETLGDLADGQKNWRGHDMFPAIAFTAG